MPRGRQAFMSVICELHKSIILVDSLMRSVKADCKDFCTNLIFWPINCRQCNYSQVVRVCKHSSLTETNVIIRSVILDVVQLSMKTYRTFKTVQIIFYLCQLLRQNFNYLCSEYIELTDSLISSLNHCVSVFCEIKIVLMLILIWIYMSCHSIP